jgi:ribonuclease G
MEKELIISSQQGLVEIALLEDKKLVELHKQKSNTQFNVGDIFVGQIKKLMPGLNAAFVDIGHKKESFLHYTDMGPLFNSVVKYTKDAMEGKYTSNLLDHFELQPEIPKHGKVNQITDKRTDILVQILKEPISTKGHRLTCEITIPGRFLVLTPFNNSIAISKKIANSDERNRLFHVVESIRPKNFGIVVRTAAEGKKVAEMHEEINMLCDKWKTMQSQLFKAKAPVKLLSELDKTSSIIRDLMNSSFERIIVNDKDIYDAIKSYLENNLPEKSNIVQFYKGSKPIFDQFLIKRQIKSSFGQTATLSSGAYIVIEHTEAMHVIDVNSGPKSQRLDQENAALKVNKEAAEEIARQLRLRDIGGLIIIDFIDMKSNENKVELYNAMKDYMAQDRSQHTILPLSKFGLMQITRQRERQELKMDTSELCPSCNGTGKVNASIFLIDTIEKDLDFILSSRNVKGLTLEVHPYVGAYLKQGIWNYMRKWYFKYYKQIKIRMNEDLPLIGFKFFEGADEEIRLKA